MQETDTYKYQHEALRHEVRRIAREVRSLVSTVEILGDSELLKDIREVERARAAGEPMVSLNELEADIDEKYPTQHGHRLPRTIRCNVCDKYTTVYEGTALPLRCFHCKQPFNEANRVTTGQVYNKPKPTPPTPAEHSVEMTRPEMRDVAFKCLDMLDDIRQNPVDNNWVYYILTKVVHALVNHHSGEMRKLHAVVRERHDATA